MRLSSGLLVLMLASTTAHADLTEKLDNVNKWLSVLSGEPARGGSNSKVAVNTAIPSAPQGATLTEAQKQQLSKQLNPKISDKQIKAMLTEASPTIEKVLGMTACFYPGNSFGAYQSSGGNFTNFPQNPWLFSHHDSAQCVNVQRIKNWRASAKNALSFSVMYVSEQSGESFEYQYEIQKQLDDVWLFNN